MVLGRHERFEEPPGPACNQSKRSRIGRRHRSSPGQSRRQTDPPCHGRGRYPEQQERSRSSPGLIAPQHGHPTSCRDGERHTARHAPIHPRQIARISILGLSRSHPLQHPCMREDEPTESTKNSIRHEPCLMHEERDGQHDLPRGQFEVGACSTKMGTQGNPGSARVESDHERQQRRNRDRGQNKPRPDPGRVFRQQPSDDQCQKRRGSRQGTAEVVEDLPTSDSGNHHRAMRLRPGMPSPE